MTLATSSLLDLRETRQAKMAKIRTFEQTNMDLAVDMIEHFCDPFPQTGFPIWVSSRHSIVFSKRNLLSFDSQQFESNVDWLPYFWESTRWHPSFHLGLCTESIGDDDFLGLWLPSCIGFGLWNWPLRSCLMFPPSAGPAGGCGSVSVSSRKLSSDQGPLVICCLCRRLYYPVL